MGNFSLFGVTNLKVVPEQLSLDSGQDWRIMRHKEGDVMTEQPRVLEFGAWRDYVSWLSTTAGSDRAVAEYLGLADGSRVSRWRAGAGGPSADNAVRLARWSGHDPLAILRLGGHTEMADLLEGTVKVVSVYDQRMSEMLETLKGVAKEAARVGRKARR